MNPLDIQISHELVFFRCFLGGPNIFFYGGPGCLGEAKISSVILGSGG